MQTRVFTILCFIFTLFSFLAHTTYAQTPTPLPAPLPSIQWTNEFIVEDEPSSIISLLKEFITSFDSFLGGFIFYTPNPLEETITLQDGSEIAGLDKYRDMFYQIAIPTIAIIIAGIAITKIGSENVQELKSFAVRFVLTIILFITVPTILSYSIKLNNALVEKISATQAFTQFLQDYFDQAQTNIDAGEEAEKYGIPSFDFSMQAGIFRSFGKFIVQIFLFAITFLFLLGSFLYIGFQFVIRFATLLFLGVLYPIIIPFMLAERTQGIVQTFFKMWFTFLIQQPAFILGFSIATDIFASILTAQGPSVGILFFYTGFLFFLGGVNTLVGRLFGDAWSVMSNSMQAAVATRSVGMPIQSRLNDFKHGLLGSNAGTLLGKSINNKWKNSDNKNYDVLPQPYKDNTHLPGHFVSYSASDTTISTPPFSKSISAKGIETEVTNAKQGVVSLKGEGYQHDNRKTGLSTIYPSRFDAVQDGVPETQLQRVNLENDQFIDLSSFNKKNPNPHNFNAMQESKRDGKELDYAYITESSPPQKVKQFLDVSKARNKAFGIKGVIVQRQAQQGTDPIIRIYTPYEKR